MMQAPFTDAVGAPHAYPNLRPPIQFSVEPSEDILRWLNEQTSAPEVATRCCTSQALSNQRFDYLSNRLRILEDHIFRRNYPHVIPRTPLISANGDVKSDFICVRNVCHQVGGYRAEALQEALRFVYGVSSLDDRGNSQR